MNPPLVLPPGTLDPTTLGFAARHRDRSQAASGRIRLPHPGRCPHQPTHTIFLFDNSGSVCGGHDTIGSRFEEATVAIERVGRACRCRAELVSVLHFDTPTSRDVLAARLGRRGRAQIVHGLAVPADGAGSSELGPSLQRAYDLSDRYPKNLSILVACTDFELLDDDPIETLDRFSAFPGLVHAVVLRAQPPQLLVNDERVTVTQVGYDAPCGAVASAVFEALTAARRRRSAVVGFG